MTFEKPIVHLVFWKLNGNTEEERKTQACKIKRAFCALKNKIDGLIRIEVGQNCVVHPEAWDISVYMVFETAQFLELYQKHPLHLEIKQMVAPMKLHRGQVDFEIDLGEIEA